MSDNDFIKEGKGLDDNPIRLTTTPNPTEWEKAARSVFSADELREVFRKTINEALRAGKTEALKQVTSQFTIKRKLIAAKPKIYFANKSQDNPSGTLVFRGRRIPLINFIVKPSGGVRQKGVPRAARKHLFVQIRKDGGGTVSNPLFIANAGKRGRGVFIRKNASTTDYDPTIDKGSLLHATGPSIAQMVNTEESREAIQGKIQEVYQRRIDHHIERMMKK